MGKMKFWGILLALLGIFCISAFGQQTGEIRGKITDEQDEALPGVTITARSPKLQGMRTALSDKDGNFRLSLLPVGSYSLTFEIPGFEKLTTLDNEVSLGFTLSLSVTLKIAAVSEEVTVTAENPLIDRVKADNSYRLKGDDLARVPSQARTIAEVVSFTPGVTGVRANTVTGTDMGLPSFRGEGDAGNNWLVDGLSTKGTWENDPGVRINYDAWEEVQIISDGFAPELGHAQGGFINILTKAGGNEFHGELGTLLRDHRLRAKRQEQLSVASLPDTSLSQFYGNLGGPFLKDRLWFFLSNNFHRSLDITEEQSIGWLTIPAGRKALNTNNLFGKITFTPRANHTLSLSGTLDKFLNQTGGIGVPETYEKAAFSDYSYRVNYRGILSQNTLLTAAWGQNRTKSETGPLDGDYGPPGYSWQDIAQTTNNSFFGDSAVERRADLNFGLMHFADLGRWGTHEFGVGFFHYANYKDSSFRFTGSDLDPWLGNGFEIGSQITWQAPGMPLQLIEFGGGKVKDSSRGFGFYVQDNFTLGRFSFMIGLRTETQKTFNDMDEEIWSWGLGDFLVPRGSLAVDLLGDGKNVLKFSFGQFANPTSLAPLQFFNREPANPFRIYSWTGGDNPSDDQLAEPLNWEFLFEQSGSAAQYVLDPELRPNKTTKYLLEFDRQLGRAWVLKLRGIYSYSKNLTEDVFLYDPEIQWVKLAYTNLELKRRDYRAFEFELNGRVADKFMLNVAYTWSRAKGTNPGNVFERYTLSFPYMDLYDISAFGEHPLVPEGEPGKEFLDQFLQGLGGRDVGDEGWYGYLPHSVDHVIKILGTYSAPLGFMISSGIEYLSGYHWEKRGWSDFGGSYMRFPEGRGVRTTPAHMYVDFAIERDIVLKQGFVLALGLNAYNLLNGQKPVSYVKEDTDLFGQVWGRQLPRWVQFKAALRF